MLPGAVWTRRDALRSGLAATLALLGPVDHRGGGRRDAGPGREGNGRAAPLQLSGPHGLAPGRAGARPPALEGRLGWSPRSSGRCMGADGRPAIALDFTSSLGPLETERYVVDARAGVEPGPEPKRGIQVEETEATFRVQSGATLAYTIGARLPGFLESVANGGREYLEPGSGGFFLRCRESSGDRAVRLGGDDGRATAGNDHASGTARRGPALRGDHRGARRGAGGGESGPDLPQQQELGRGDLEGRRPARRGRGAAGRPSSQARGRAGPGRPGNRRDDLRRPPRPRADDPDGRDLRWAARRRSTLGGRKGTSPSR